jgi:hypothetical protein
MDSMWSASRKALAFCLTGAVLSGCSAEAQDMQAAPSAAEQPDLSVKVVPRHGHTRCAPFESNFDEVVACERADGTLRAFEDASIAWRVRFFVRYSEMPCGEYPTVEESYTFHTVVHDLDRDHDLNGSQRAAIRTAMFDGKVRCS